MYCPNCGNEIKDQEQKFCEQCGVELKFNGGPKQQTPPNPRQKMHSHAGLFDLSRKYYIIHEKSWGFGSGDIYDKNGNVIGRMDREFLNIHRKVDLKEIDGTVAATIEEKVISLRGENRILDVHGNLIAVIKKKITSFIHPKFWLEDPDENRWYEAKGEFMGWSFRVIESSTGKTIAEIEKADKWRDIFLGGIFNYQDKYALKILDDETDRRILVAFVLSIDNVLHDVSHGFGAHTRWGPGPFPRRGTGGGFPGRFPGRGRWSF